MFNDVYLCITLSVSIPCGTCRNVDPLSRGNLRIQFETYHAQRACRISCNYPLTSMSIFVRTQPNQECVCPPATIAIYFHFSIFDIFSIISSMIFLSRRLALFYEKDGPTFIVRQHQCRRTARNDKRGIRKTNREKRCEVNLREVNFGKAVSCKAVSLMLGFLTLVTNRGETVGNVGCVLAQTQPATGRLQRRQGTHCDIG